MSKYNTVRLEQGSPEWLEWRRSHITASNVASIMGRSKFGTKLSVYEEMVEGKTKPMNRAMQNGIEKEEEARIWAEKKLNLSLFPIVAESVQFPWAGASLDGYDLMTETVVEIKCPGKETHMIAIGGEIPEHYQIQMQWQMFITGAKNAFYISYYDNKGVSIPLKRDQDKIDKMVCICKKFFEDNIQKKRKPSPSDDDYLIREDKEWIEKAEPLKKQLEMIKDAKDLLAQMEFEADILKSQLENEANGVTRIKGGGITYYQYLKPGSIQYDRIPELAKVDLEKYKKSPIVVTVAKLSSEI